MKPTQLVKWLIFCAAALMLALLALVLAGKADAKLLVDDIQSGLGYLVALAILIVKAADLPALFHPPAANDPVPPLAAPAAPQSQPLPEQAP